MDSFEGLIKKAAIEKPILPLCHTCDVFDFMNILKENKLNISECHYFNQKLLYLFYGKPAYRLPKNYITSSVSLLPVIIAINLNEFQNIERIAPFDTGAFFEGIYSSHIHHKMQCKDFLLPSDLKVAGRVVTQFFKNNKKYYKGSPKKNKLTSICCEAESYENIIHDKIIRHRDDPSRTIDDRSRTIEVQTSKPLDLNHNNVMFVMLPKKVLHDDDVRNILQNKWGIKPISYTSHTGNSNEYVALLYKEFKDFLKKNDYL